MSARICGPCDVGAHDLCGSCPCCPSAASIPLTADWTRMIGDLAEAGAISDGAALLWLSEVTGFNEEETLVVRIADVDRRLAEAQHAADDDWVPEDEWRRWGQ